MNDERLLEQLAAHAGPADVDPAFEDHLYTVLQREMRRSGRSYRPVLLLAAALLLGLAVAGAALVGSGILKLPELTEEKLPKLAEESVPPPPQTVVGAWNPTDSMIEGREGHTATLLSDGRVLVAGGSESGSSELYDPGTGTWTASGDLTEARVNHTATLLPDGKVLVVGGVRPGLDETGTGNNIPVSSAELYDPATESWTSAGNTREAHGRGHTATLLPTGRVLVAGGGVLGGRASAELYDPISGSWIATGSMGDARWYHTATLLPDGTVLVAGSVSSVSSAELFDPATGIWTATGSMVHGRHDFTATLLANGTVLATAYEGSETAELYDPATGSWSETGSMSDVHLGTYRATLLPDGTVLVTGGVPNRDEVVELYDPATGIWVRAADPDNGRRYHTATLLPDGTVLVAGGSDNAASAELYIPRTR